MNFYFRFGLGLMLLSVIASIIDLVILIHSGQLTPFWIFLAASVLLLAAGWLIGKKSL